MSYKRVKKSIYVLITVLLVILSKIFVINASAEVSMISFDPIKDTIEASEDVVFSVRLTEKKSKDPHIIIEYPEKFLLDMESIQQKNKEPDTSIIDDSENKQLIIESKGIDKEINVEIKGKLKEIGVYCFVARYGESAIKRQITVNNDAKDMSSEVNINKDDTSSKENKIEEPFVKSDSTNSSSGALEPIIDRNVSTFAGLPTFDWELLNNDGLDLSTFTKVDVNTPVKLTGGIFDIQQRNYYLFLGHNGSGTFSNTTLKFRTKNDMFVSMSTTDSMDRPLLNPALLGVKKGKPGTESNVIDHTYAGLKSTSFDIGEMDPVSGEINFSGSTGVGKERLLISQYVKDNELVAYGFIKRGRPEEPTKVVDLQPVRIHGYILSYKTGRIRYDISYYNSSNMEKTYAVTYGMHIDIGGAHTNSKLFSNEKDGLYFDEEATPRDGIGESLYFHMDGYNNNKGPTALKVGNFNAVQPLAYWSEISSTKTQWLYGPVAGCKNPYDSWDDFQPKGYKFPLSHPIFAYRWDPVTVPSGGVGMNSFDISLEEKGEVMPNVEKKYRNLTSKDGKNHIGDTLQFTLSASNNAQAKGEWESVSIVDALPKELDIDVSSIKLIDSIGEKTDMPPECYNPSTHILQSDAIDISSGESIEIVFDTKIVDGAGSTIINNMVAKNGIENETRESEVSIYVEPEQVEFQLIQEVLHLDGSKAEFAKKGEQLVYRTILKNPFVSKEKEQSYKILQISTNELDSNLENFSDLTFKDEQGNRIGIVLHEPISNKIYALFEKNINMSLNAKQNLYLEYKATVKNSVKIDAIISAKSFAYATLTNGSQLKNTESNGVNTLIRSGELTFISAPQILDFGSNLKIDSKNKTYPVKSIDSPLTVQDSREKGSTWNMTATLTKELTSTTKHELTDSLFYREANQDVPFILGVSNKVFEKITQDDSVVNISDEWKDAKSGPFLAIKAGKARPESYNATIKWTLQNVPSSTDPIN